MRASVGYEDRLKTGLKLTNRERRFFHDEDERCVLPDVLARDAYFNAKAQLIAARPPEQWSDLAIEEAATYAPYSGSRRNRNRKLIAELLMSLAADPSGQGLRNYRRQAVWADDESPQTLEPSRIRNRFPSLLEGAKLVARFGAGRCLDCGRPLSGLHEQSGSSRRGRRRYCGAHASLERLWGSVHQEKMKAAFEAATAHHRLRRAHRR